jgi:hypothetical protein
LREWAASYGYGGRIDKLYRDEIGRRMAENEHYLDYTGSSLYCSSVLKAVFDDLQVPPLLLLFFASLQTQTWAKAHEKVPPRVNLIQYSPLFSPRV